VNRSFFKVVFFLSLFSLFTQMAVASENVRVAVAGPMVGTSNSVGMQYNVGVTAALSNLPDGKLLGLPVELSLHDDNCEASIAEAVALQIVENPPAVVIGHSCSGATIAAAPIYAKHNVLQITPASTNPRVTEMGIKTIFRMIGRDDTQGRLAAQLMATRHGGRRIGVLFFPGAYSFGLSTTAVKTLEEGGITPVAVVQARASETSYADEIEELIRHGVELLYLVGGALDSGIFLRQARLMDATFDVIGSDTVVSDIFLKAAGDAANGVIFTFPPEAVHLTTAAPAVETIRAGGHDPAGYTLLAYAATQVWIEGVKRADSFDADKVAEAISRESTPTILGKVAFDKKGDIITSYAPFAWYEWKDGRRVPLD
jgi:branched-chain amino acid transport system substrate-binding protein